MLLSDFIVDQFNNIMAVMGKNSNEITTLHLVKTYCLPTLLFGCEIWNLTEVCINLIWHGITAFDIYFEILERKWQVTAVFLWIITIVLFVGLT